MRIGAIPMPGPNLLTPNDVAYRLDRGHATAAITDEAGAAKVDQTGASLSVKFCVGGAPRG
jgi:acetyl-CoA synthetase